MSAIKRRASHAAPEMSTPDPAKRIRKRNDDTHFPDVESVETTIDLGRKIIGLLKRSQDKNGRLVASHFLDLPDRRLYPDYYQQTPMPLSLNGIEKTLETGGYDTMEALEADLKRMVQNAKDYNSTKSEVFEDAERIRKALSNFMPKHNPAYLNPDYRAYPTPLPQHIQERVRESSASGSEQPSIKLRLSTGGRRRQSVAASTEEDDPAELETAQLELLDELSAEESAVNFEEKPSKREIPHYYKVIERPTSISDVRNMVQRGRVKDWAELAREVRLIWSNAKEYNEPGSDIYTMAEGLETWFEEKLQAKGVPPRATTRISLKTQPKAPALKLNVRSTSTPSRTDYKVDNEALQRQKREMDQALDRARRGSTKGETTPIPVAPTNVRRSISVADQKDVEMTGMNGHTPETTSSVPPEPVKAPVPPGPSHLPTPVLNGEPPQAITKPVLSPSAPITNGVHPSDSANQANRSLYMESNNPMERKYRDPGKGIEDALLESVIYMTHPNLPNDPKWKITRYASPTKTQTTSYIYLPHNHSYFRVIPNLSAELRSRKRHKLCVTHNWQIVPASPSAMGGGVYDLPLRPGENVIAVDVIAELKDGEKKEYAPPQLQVDFERITFYVILRDRDAE